MLCKHCLFKWNQNPPYLFTPDCFFRKLRSKRSRRPTFDCAQSWPAAQVGSSAVERWGKRLRFMNKSRPSFFQEDQAPPGSIFQINWLLTVRFSGFRFSLFFFKERDNFVGPRCSRTSHADKALGSRLFLPNFWTEPFLRACVPADWSVWQGIGSKPVRKLFQIENRAHNTPLWTTSQRKVSRLLKASKSTVKFPP